MMGFKIICHHDYLLTDLSLHLQKNSFSTTIKYEISNNDNSNNKNNCNANLFFTCIPNDKSDFKFW